MQKDFDKWNEKKKTINNERELRLYHAREIWWCSLGINVGAEEDGTGEKYDRPVLVLAGLSRKTCLIAPLTSSGEIHKMRIPIGTIDRTKKENSVIISQIRVIDTKRLIYKIGFLNKSIFETITKAIKDLL